MRRLAGIVIVAGAVAACTASSTETSGADGTVPAFAGSTAAVDLVPPSTASTTRVPATLGSVAPTTGTSTSTTSTTTTSATTAPSPPSTTSTPAPTTTTSTSTTTAPPSTTTTATPISGRTLFRTNCAVCHGEEGEGGYGSSLQLSSLTLSQIIETVTYGRGAMEPWVDVLSAEEIEAVARYVKRLQTG